MKIKYIKFPKKLFDPVAVHLYYLQVMHHVLAGDYPTTPTVLMKLAALKFAVNFGAHKPSIHKLGFIEYEERERRNSEEKLIELFAVRTVSRNTSLSSSLTLFPRKTYWSDSSTYIQNCLQRLISTTN